MTYQSIRTSRLDIGYLEWNPGAAQTIVLNHGWPDSPETWSIVAALLADHGFRVLCPALRGFGPTHFLEPETPRSGQLAALGRDLLDFVDVLDLRKPVLVGHGWGARAAANACGLRPGVASHLVMFSVGYGTNDPHQSISYEQAGNYWYHWYLATPRGEAAVRDDRRAFARMMWDTWSPRGWYSDAEFDETAVHFDTPGWADVVLHSYRHRWGFVEGDETYAADEAILNPPPTLDVPTLVLHGLADTCNHPDTSKGKEAFFKGPYRRELLEHVGHFPQREQPRRVAERILAWINGISG